MGQLRVVTCIAFVFFAAKGAPSAHGKSMNLDQNPPNASATTRIVVERFNEAFNNHDLDALASLLTDDTIFEDTSPPPDGKRIEGKAAVVAFWRGWFAGNPDARFRDRGNDRQW